MRSGLLQHWRLPLGLLAPAILCFVTAVAGVTGFMVWAAAQSDQRALENALRQARFVVSHQLEQTTHDQESVAIWDDSVLHAKMLHDHAWVRDNLGTWMHDYFGHDETIVLTDQNTTRYAIRGGEDVEASEVQSQVSDLMPLIAQLRDKIRTDTPAGQPIDNSKNHFVRDVVRLAGMPAFVSIMPLVSDTGFITQQPGTEYLLVSVIFLDAKYSGWLRTLFPLADVVFSDIAPTDALRTVLPVTSAAGRIITFASWMQGRPGTTMVQQAMPVLIGAFLILGAVLAVLLYRVGQSAMALELSRAEAQHRANHDALTGLANRAQFDAELARAVSPPRARDVAISVILLDLDRFKQVNDTLGHQAGDDLIRAVGQRLQQSLAPDDLLARLGGDEFGIIHHHRPGQVEPMRLSQRIIDSLSKPFDIKASEAFIGVSIGVAPAEPLDFDALELIRRADIALFEAKATGRGRAVVFEEAMNQLLQNRHAIEAELREALKRTDQLSVAFQPLYDAKTSRIIGAEALARWHHPKFGNVSPAQFIPIAESSGLIEQLGDFVLGSACELGARFPGLSIAVNISPVQLRNPRFGDRIFTRLLDSGMRARDLEIEITENILLEDAGGTSDALRVLREADVRIALDDFGTGYSSLNYLKRYPVDRIKIDRSFVSQLSPSTASSAIVEAMVKLAHALGIDVTAEGVETVQQQTILRELGANVLQGFLLSPPLTLPALEKLLSASDLPSSQVA